MEKWDLLDKLQEKFLLGNTLEFLKGLKEYQQNYGDLSPLGEIDLEIALLISKDLPAIEKEIGGFEAFRLKLHAEDKTASVIREVVRIKAELKNEA